MKSLCVGQADLRLASILLLSQRRKGWDYKFATMPGGAWVSYTERKSRAKATELDAHHTYRLKARSEARGACQCSITGLLMQHVGSRRVMSSRTASAA